MNIGEAQNLVKSEFINIDNSEDEIVCILLNKETIEKPWGWVFFYQNQKFIETNNIKYALAGNAPYLVNRHTGQLTTTGTANSIEYYIKEYEQTL